jgi:transcriptional regulator with XRE-family HTH domain
LTVEAQQIDLPIRPRPANPVAEVPLEVILRQPSRLAVIQLQIHAAGLTDDQVAAELGIDASQWSRIMSGKSAHFPTEKYHRLNQVTGNHYVLLWDLAQEGLDPASVRPLRSALERQLEEERARNADLQREMATMQRYIRMSSGRD